MRATPAHDDRTPRTLLATLPTGAFPGVDTTEVYEFLDAHAPA